MFILGGIYENVKSIDEKLDTVKMIEIENIDTLSQSSNTSPYQVLFVAMVDVESKNNPKAIGDGGRARGILQMHAVCVDDINQQCYGYRKYTWDDAFHPEKSEEMFHDYAEWIVKNRAPLYPHLSKEEVIARHWNGGYKFQNKKSTITYWRKVQKKMQEIS